MNEAIHVWYLYHSGFAIRIKDYLFVFDYYLDKPSGSVRALSTGVINPEEIKDYHVLVFSSHKHPDHFNPIIFNWQTECRDIRYFLSYDIPKKYHSQHTVLKPREIHLTHDGIKVSTLKSTDAGVAFLVESEGIKIYHAGDLNWWHWEEESKAWNNDMAARFKNELLNLKDKTIDLAILTCDPRQERQTYLGMQYFLQNIRVRYAFPMHFGDNASILSELEELKKKESFWRPVCPIHKRGEEFILQID